MGLKFYLPTGLAALSVIAAACTALPATSQTDAEASTPPAIAEDGREILYLTADQRAHVRSQMRGFITGVQALTAALAAEDRTAIAEAAASMGRPNHGQMGQGHGPGHGQGMGRGPGNGQGMGHGQGQGMRHGQQGGGGMMGGMPAPFPIYGRATHIGFEEIAAMAETADFIDMQRAFAANLENCVTCHSSYTARDAQ